MEKHDFKLVGLSKPASATLEHLNSDKHTFKAIIDMSEDRISALWNLCENDWKTTKIAEIECDKLNDNGIPINARMVGIRFS